MRVSDERTAKDVMSTIFQGRCEEELRAWMLTNGVPDETLRRYGTGGAKTLHELLTETHLGESTLWAAEGRAFRKVEVVNIFIIDDSGRVLQEEKQVFPDGRRRSRGLPLSEKMMAGESWQEAAARGVVEELGSMFQPQQPQVELLVDTHVVKEGECRESHSYPGLFSLYDLHKVQARVLGLPAESFRTEEQRNDGVLVNHWRWVTFADMPNCPYDPLA